jgi:hypothetical protein
LILVGQPRRARVYAGVGMYLLFALVEIVGLLVLS